MTSQLRAYIDGWRRHDVAAVLDTLTSDCVVIESYGPVYRGRERVEQCMHAWFGAGGGWRPGTSRRTTRPATC
jgi:ketosteroid isomerase-like protein